MKKVQKTLALVLAAVLLVAGTFAATVAWMTADAPEKKNVFTVGDISITLEEEVDVEGEGGTVTETSDGAKYEGVMPGDYLVKEVTIENTGNIPAYVALTVDVNNADKIAAAIENYTPAYTAQQIQAIYDVVFENWGMKYENGVLSNALPTDAKLLEVETEVANNAWALTYYLYLEPGESFVPFTGLNAPAFFENDQMDMFKDLEILVNASAIQADNFATADAAFAALAGETTPMIPDAVVTDQAGFDAALAEGKDVYLAAGTYTANKKLAGGMDTTIIGEGADKTVISGQIAATSSTEGVLTLKDLTVKVDSSIVDQTGISQTGKSAIGIWGNQTVICENVTFDMSLSNGTAITSWWDTGAGTSIILRNCTFNCNGQRPVRATGNVTVENCTFNDPYRYAVQLTAKTSTATEMDKAIINFNGNTIVNGENGKAYVYGIQLEGEEYGCHDCVINGNGNTIVDGGAESTMYYCECGKTDHATISWNTEVAPVHAN